MRKALEPFADIADLIDSETEGVSDTDILELRMEDFLFQVFSVAQFRAARSALNEDPWKPIETAPKGGTPILIWLGGSNHPKLAVARWYEPWGNWQVGTLPSDPAREEYYGIGALVPTHWMFVLPPRIEGQTIG